MTITQGPWRVDPTSPCDVQTEDGTLEIACTHEGVLLGGEKPSISEQVTNARLIATAPELLEALKEMIRMAEREGWEGFEKAKALIAKASPTTTDAGVVG